MKTRVELESGEQFSDEEAKQRFEAALRGARAVGPLPMKELPSKRGKKPDRAQSGRGRGPKPERDDPE
jgi:hypothetical protein